VRSVGSIGGNLCMAKKNGFLSDLATILIGAEATVTLATSPTATRVISLLEFVSTPSFASSNEILLSISIPFNRVGDHYNSYKVAMRATNAHAFINAAFKVNVDSKTNLITHSVLAYGGVMQYDIAGAHPIRASRTEAYITGRPLTQETLQASLKILNDEVKPVGERAEYRQRLASSYFYKFFLSLLKYSLFPSFPLCHTVLSYPNNDMLCETEIVMKQKHPIFDQQQVM
jgi:abscisic-aldehyde oxidase